MTSVKAWLSFLCGVAALPTFGVTALPALVLGYAALRDIHLSDGRLGGRRAAAAGLVLGALGLVALLVGLVLLGLDRVAARNRQTACLNNLRRLGEAVHLYHEQKEHYPSGTIRIAGREPEERLSWLADLLPFMEPGRRPSAHAGGAALYEQLDPKRAWDAAENRAVVATRSPWFLCPNRLPPHESGTPGPTAYLGIAGVGVDAATLANEHPRAGFFGYDRVIARDDLTRGQATTLVAAEAATAYGPWARGGPATVRAVVPEERPYFGPERPFGGLHEGGTMALFADRSARLVADGISPTVWEAHATIHAEP